MELWIRSQDKECLMKVNRLDCDFRNGLCFILADDFKVRLATYESEARAKEILDEICYKIKNQFIVKEKSMLKPEDLMHHKKWLEYEYNSDFIMQDISCEIQPINSGIVYYEMPEE